MLPHPESCLRVSELQQLDLINRAANERRAARGGRDRRWHRVLLSASAIALFAAVAHALIPDW